MNLMRQMCEAWELLWLKQWVGPPYTNLRLISHSVIGLQRQVDESLHALYHPYRIHSPNRGFFILLNLNYNNTVYVHKEIDIEYIVSDWVCFLASLVDNRDTYTALHLFYHYIKSSECSPEHPPE